MSYQALYRKYRPMTFDEVVGQNVAKKTLQNALKTGKISHAYLFSGPRGTGKTSIAKIFAKAVNCLDPKNGNPCLQCERCLAVARRECSDIIEIDAASNNGVDEIRELRNNVSLVPSELKYKVYIIDEVHMLSIGAFNALLKTLEEPPSHVIFILATTDLHKVPITIISRCQCFSFKRITERDLIDRLEEIVKLEQISIDDAVLSEIAKYSDGGMRDALGMLDKLVSYSSDKITLDDMREINGLISETELTEFVQKVQEKDILWILERIDYLYQNGKDMIRLVEELILNLRNQLVHKYLDHVSSIDDVFLNDFAVMLNQLLVDLKNSSNIKVLFEIRLLKFMNSTFSNEVSSISSQEKEIFDKQVFDFQEKEIRSLQKEEKAEISTEEAESIPEVSSIETKESVSSPTFVSSHSENFKKREKLRINNTFALASKNDLLEIKQNWSLIMDYTLDREIGAIACFLADGTPVAASSKNLILSFEYSSMVERGNDMIDRIELALEKILNHFYHVVLLTNEDWIHEKKEFIDSKSKQIEYHYQEEELEKEDIVPISEENASEDLSDLTKTAIQLFGKSVVKIDD